MREIIVDNFAGGGGASTGIEMATGRSVDIAINHDPEAIKMHQANHPDTKHYCESVWDVDPVKACAGRMVGLAWFSPDCKHFSKAKGGKPVEKKIRGLAWIVLKWAALVRPRVIMLENVEEFQTWGPVRKGKPIKSKKGQTYNKWRGQLENLGYQVETNELIACDYGAPTKRKRFFMIARCDSEQIVWPDPTHGDRNSEEVMKGLLKPYVSAAEIIDWNIPCQSIFKRKKPLAENTMKRIAKGLQKFVIDNPDPYIIQSNNGLITPALIQYHSETTANGVRGQAITDPIMTLDSSPRYGLVSAFISKYYAGGYKGASSTVTDPLSTVTAVDHNSLVTAHIIQMNNNSIGTDMNEPLNTIVAGPGHMGEVRAFLIKYYGQGTGQDIKEPLDTVVSKDRFGLVTIEGQDYQIVDIGLRMLEPHELYAAQGFPPDYIIDHDLDGHKISKTEQVKRCGNAVPPPFVSALVKSNLPELCTGKRMPNMRIDDSLSQLQFA